MGYGGERGGARGRAICEPELSLDWETESTSEQKAGPSEEAEAMRAGKGGKWNRILHCGATGGFKSHS